MKAKPGDIVRLKTGGPEMTAGYFHSENDLYCQWFVSHGELKWGVFSLNSLLVLEKRETEN